MCVSVCLSRVYRVCRVYAGLSGFMGLRIPRPLWCGCGLVYRGFIGFRVIGLLVPRGHMVYIAFIRV